MTSLFQDIRHALRMMARNPGFTLVVVLTLAIGIAASATVFGWVDTILLHPLPGVDRPDTDHRR